MLHTESVDSNTFELLQTLMADPLLDGFFLAGGTNIALRIGHRKSIDLDGIGTMRDHFPSSGRV